MAILPRVTNTPGITAGEGLSYLSLANILNALHAAAAMIV